ncbi:MAG: NAD(P)-dependent oxidoreductase [Oscillospiraceae bacterium]
MKQTILISGIKGFLGSNLAKTFSKNCAIYGIGKQNEIYNGIKVYASSELNNIPLKPDFIILCHAAVESGRSRLPSKLLFDVNVDLTKKIIEKFCKAKIIYISSTSIYDSNTHIIYEDSPVNPKSEYAISKLWAEKIVLETERSMIFRLSSLYGIEMRENTIIPNYVNQALTNKVIEVWGKGERIQNYILVNNACNYIKYAMQEFGSIKNKVLLAVGKEEFSNHQLALIIAKDTNASIKYVGDDFSKSSRYDNHVTCNLLHWEPQEKLESEIRKYIKWKKEQY